MIIGVGTDIVLISRIESLYQKTGDKFLSRILTNSEIKIFNSKTNDSQKITYLAKRFAVKEAISKAMGVGIGEELRFRDIEIFNDSKGKPKAFVKNCENLNIQISLSDEKQGYAVAFAIAEELS